MEAGLPVGGRRSLGLDVAAADREGMSVRRAPGTRPPAVGDLMSAVLIAEPGWPLAEAARRMRAERVGAAVVAGAGATAAAAGILTERDLLRAIADGADPATTPVAAYATADPAVAAPADSARSAAATMIAMGIRHLPVVDAGRVVGLISARNLLRLGTPDAEALLELGGEPW